MSTFLYAQKITDDSTTFHVDGKKDNAVGTEKIEKNQEINDLIFTSEGQMGIGTLEPKVTLEIKAKNHINNPDKSEITDGIIIPRVIDLPNLKDLSEEEKNNRKGQLLFLTQNYSNEYKPGFYYWTGSKWVSMTQGESNESTKNSLNVEIGGFTKTNEGSVSVTNASNLNFPSKNGFQSPNLTAGNLVFRLYVDSQHISKIHGGTGNSDIDFNNYVRTQVKNIGQQPLEIYFYSFSEYLINGGISNFGAVTLPRNKWVDLGEFGIFVNKRPEEKRQYVITTQDNNDKNYWRVEFMGAAKNIKDITTLKAVIHSEYFYKK